MKENYDLIDKEIYVSKIDKKINKLNKLKKIITTDNIIKKDGYSYPDTSNKVKPIIEVPINVKEVVKPKTPLNHKKEFREAIYKDTKPLNLIDKLVYENFKNEDCTTDTYESIVKRTITHILPDDSTEDSSKLYYFSDNDTETLKASISHKPIKPTLIDTKDNVNFLIGILNEKTGDEIKIALINILLKHIEEDKTSIKISDLFCEIKGKMYAPKNIKELYEITLNNKVNEIYTQIKSNNETDNQ